MAPDAAVRPPATAQCALALLGNEDEDLGAMSLPPGAELVVGRHSEVTFPIADPALLDRHLVVQHREDGLHLTAFGGTRVNGRALAEPLLLVGGDVIEAGATRLKVMAPLGDGYPVARITNGFWAIMSAEAGWDVAPDHGMQRNAAGLVENLYVVHDTLGVWGDLKSYVVQQRRLLGRVYEQFAGELYQGTALYGCSDAAFLSARFEYGGKPVSQLQFYGLKGEQVGIATWSVPPDFALEDARFPKFDALLELLHFH